MKAAILTELHAPLTVDEVELSPLGEGQVLVKVLVSGICGAQMQEIAGLKGNAAYVPHLLGHEGCGIVEDIGVGVTSVRKGDKVVLHWRPGEGAEASFPSYIWKGKKIGGGRVTTFSQYTIASENRVTAVPHETPNDLAALLGCGLSTALGVIKNEADVQPGETVMVVGFGGLGACLVRSARVYGATRVIAVDIHDGKKELALSIGADIYVNSKTENIREALDAAFGTSHIDVVIETSGNARSIEESIALVGNSGRCVLVGHPKPGETIALHNAHHFFGGEGKTLKATQGGKFVPQRDLTTYLALHSAGELPFADLVTHRATLDTINDAIELMRAGKANRILIDLWP